MKICMDNLTRETVCGVQYILRELTHDLCLGLDSTSLNFGIAARLLPCLCVLIYVYVCDIGGG